MIVILPYLPRSPCPTLMFAYSLGPYIVRSKTPFLYSVVNDESENSALENCAVIFMTSLVDSVEVPFSAGSGSSYDKVKKLSEELYPSCRWREQICI